MKQTIQIHSIGSIRIHNAIVFAAKALDGNHFRDSYSPSIVRPMEVMQILAENGCDENVIIAGILHDFNVRSSVEQDDIVNNFGQYILELAQFDWEDMSKPWRERKQAVVNNLSDASLEIQLIFCAETLSTLKSIYAEKLVVGDKIYSILDGPQDQIKWYYEEIDKALDKVDDYPMKQEFIWFTKVLFS